MAHFPFGGPCNPYCQELSRPCTPQKLFTLAQVSRGALSLTGAPGDYSVIVNYNGIQNPLLLDWFSFYRDDITPGQQIPATEGSDRELYVFNTSGTNKPTYSQINYGTLNSTIELPAGNTYLISLQLKVVTDLGSIGTVDFNLELLATNQSPVLLASPVLALQTVFGYQSAGANREATQTFQYVLRTTASNRFIGFAIRNDNTSVQTVRRVSLFIQQLNN